MRMHFARVSLVPDTFLTFYRHDLNINIRIVFEHLFIHHSRMLSYRILNRSIFLHCTKTIRKHSLKLCQFIFIHLVYVMLLNFYVLGRLQLSLETVYTLIVRGQLGGTYSMCGFHAACLRVLGGTRFH